MSSLRSRPRRRAAVALVALLALVLAASACSAVGQPPAATVEGTDISADVVDEIVEAYIEADPETYGAPFKGDGADTLSMDPVSNVLGSLVVQELQSQLAQDRGVTPTDEERTQAEDAVRTSFVQQEQAAPEGEGPSESEQTSTAVFEALAESTQEYLIDLRADALALSRELGSESGAADAAARAFYDQNPMQFTAVCLRLLAVAEPDLPAVQARLDAGEDFGDVSREVSVDPQVVQALDGPPQCTALSQLQSQLQPEAFQQLASAAEGDVVGPFAFDDQGNVVLVEIQSTQLTPFEEVREAILTQIPAPGDQAVSDLLTREAPEADVSVDPRFGTWDPDQARVLPPDGADAPAGDGTSEPVEGVPATDAPG